MVFEDGGPAGEVISDVGQRPETTGPYSCLSRPPRACRSPIEGPAEIYSRVNLLIRTHRFVRRPLSLSGSTRRARTTVPGLSDNQGMVLKWCKPIFGLLSEWFLAGWCCGAGGINIAVLGQHGSRMKPCDVT
jgi:hypothetical protein